PPIQRIPTLLAPKKNIPRAPFPPPPPPQKNPKPPPPAQILDFALGFGPPLHVCGSLMVNRLHRRIGFGAAVGGLIVGHALLEGFDAAGNVTHHVRDLVAASEPPQDYGADDQPMPDAQGTHEILRPPDAYAYSLIRGARGLGARGLYVPVEPETRRRDRQKQACEAMPSRRRQS